jgi:amidophosphoribosyltransferase
MGLVAQVFTEANLAPLTGHLAIGHTRYSTTGSSTLRNAQPYLVETLYGPLAVAHNGNLTNAQPLRQQLLARGVGLSSTTDSELITQILAAPPETWNGSNGKHSSNDHWIDRIRAFMRIAQGAYSLALLTTEAVYAVRDPLGMRPLCLGRIGDGYVIASESCALGTIGAELIRQIEPGEIVRLDEHGVTSVVGVPSDKRALCMFEYVYFARPDSDIEGQVIHQVRQRMGQQLAREVPADADIVVAVPDSAIPAAIGYSLQTGIPFTEGLIKNRYIGRTFIQPDDALRQQGVRLKYNALEANLRGRRVVLVDDSIVRGNTIRPLVQLLRDGGAAEIHVRVSSPPVKHPCFMGVDMATYKDLIAHHLDADAIARRAGADSLGYLSLEGMLAAVGQDRGYCTACFSGRYPIDIPEWLFADDREKMIFEEVWA